MEPGLRDIGDPGDRIGEPRQWIDIVELGGTYQRVHKSGALTAAVGADEQP